MKIIKNPVIIAVVAGLIVYTYMSWNRKKENEKRLKKGKKIKSSNKYDNIIIPGVSAVIVWFIAYAYFTRNTVQQVANPVGQPVQNYELVKDTSVYAGSPWGFDTFKWVSNKISLYSQDLVKGAINGQDPVTFTDVSANLSVLTALSFILLVSTALSANLFTKIDESFIFAVSTALEAN